MSTSPFMLAGIREAWGKHEISERYSSVLTLLRLIELCSSNRKSGIFVNAPSTKH